VHMISISCADCQRCRDNILISEHTLRAVRTRLGVTELEMSGNAIKKVGDMKVYELLDRRMEKAIETALVN